MSVQLVAASTQYLKLIGAGGLTGGPITIACWFKPNDINTQEVLMSMGVLANTTPLQGMALTGNISGGGIYPHEVYVLNESSNLLPAGSPTYDTSWHHAAASWDTGVRKGYLDGSVVSDATAADAFSDLTIGVLCRSALDVPFGGLIGYAAVWNIALSDANITSLAGGALPSSIQGSHLIGYWTLVSDPTDSSGNGNNLTAVNSPSYSGDNPITSVSFTVSPSTIPPSDSSPITLMLTGAGTTWSSGSSVARTNSLTGTTAVTLGTWTRISDSSATLTVTTGAGSGTWKLTIDGVDSPTLTTAVTPIPINDSHIYYSPNWVFSGSTYAQSNDCGCYLKTNFSGTSLSVNVDVSTFVDASIDSTLYPVIAYSVDGAGLTRVQLTPSTTSVSIASSLSPGTHSLFVQFVGESSSVDDWVTPVNVFRITGILLDDGAALSSPTVASRFGMYFGDSITRGIRVINDSDLPTGNDASACYCDVVSASLGVEFAQIGMATGWVASGPGTRPALPGSWNYQSSGVSRSFSPAPSFVYVEEGTNDTTDITSTVEAWLVSARAALPSTCPIFIQVPFNQNSKSYITAAVAASTDPYVYLIDLGTTGANIVLANNAGDNLHPNATGHALLAALIEPIMQPYLASFTVSPASIFENQLIGLTLVGYGTNWTSGSTVSIQNSVTGTTDVITGGGGWLRFSANSAVLVVNGGVGTGTFTITVDGVVSPALTVAAVPAFGIAIGPYPVNSVAVGPLPLTSAAMGAYPVSGGQVGPYPRSANAIGPYPIVA